METDETVEAVESTEEAESTEKVDSTGATRSTGRTVAGIVLVLPAILCCITELLIPTLRTFWLSLNKADILSDAQFVGLENYSRLFSHRGFGEAVGFTVIGIIVRLVVVAVVPLLLAWAVGQFGRPVRLGVRVLLTVPVALFIPIGIAIVWVLALNPRFGMFAIRTPLLAGPNTAKATLLFVDALYTFGLACGLGIIFYLPIWRRPDGAHTLTFKEMLKPVAGVWGIGILATIVLTLNSFVLGFAMTRGGPANSTSTLGLLIYTTAFAQFQFGPAASLASIILIITLVLGTVAGLLVIFTRLRLTTVSSLESEKTENDETPSQNKTLPIIILAITLLLSLGACLLSVIPFGWVIPQSFGEGGFGYLLEQISVVGMTLYTIFPPLIAALIQLGVVYLAALGIGALQPIGKQSQWLLLLFSPWLFVTVLPLSLIGFMSARDMGTLDTFIGLLSPILLSVPTLFILTIFFRGQAPRWQAAADTGGSSAFFKQLILPSLPLAGVLFVFLLFIGWTDTLWPLLVSRAPDSSPLSVALLQLFAVSGMQTGVMAAAVTLLVLPITLLFFVILVVFQVFYLDRLTLRSDNN